MMHLRRATARILGPVIRVLIARGVRFPEFSDWLKEVYLSVAERHFRLEGKRMTVSRASLLTGLQRKDINAIKARNDRAEPETGAGPLPRVLAHWQAAPGYQDETGAPLALPRAADRGPSFEALVAEVSRDIHPRTVLDELVRLGLVGLADDRVVPLSDAFLPSRDDAALLGYFGANLGDHAAAAAQNVLAAPDPGPHFERAVHYNHLTPGSRDDLDALARKLLGQSLAQINARALALQKRDRGKPDAIGAFRSGAFIYCQPAADNDEEAS